MNLVDPRLFKQGAGVGEWVDALARLEGPVVAQLAAVLIGDWMLGTDESLQDIITNAQLHVTEPQGDVDIQVVPSGPQETGDGLLQMLLALIHSAEEELVLTTPYLVLDDSMMYALRSAAGRGVKVTLIVPKKVDSLPTRYASQSYYDDLLEMGVEIYLYRRGLLHTKSIMADGARSMFGTVNLDLRSFWLDYEVALFVYDSGFAEELRALQQTYLDDSDRVDPVGWGTRTFKERFLENLFRLMSPLL
jgi:cardiolipin synthase